MGRAAAKGGAPCDSAGGAEAGGAACATPSTARDRSAVGRASAESAKVVAGVSAAVPGALGNVGAGAGVRAPAGSNARYESPVARGSVASGPEPVCGPSAAGRPVVKSGKTGASGESAGCGPEGGNACRGAGVSATVGSNARNESPVVRRSAATGPESVCGSFGAGGVVVESGKTGAGGEFAGRGPEGGNVCCGAGVWVTEGSKARNESPVVRRFAASGPEPVCGSFGAGRVVGEGGTPGPDGGLPISRPAAWRAGSAGGCVCATGGPKAP